MLACKLPKVSSTSVLIYVNNLADELSNARLFADGTSLLSVVHNLNTSAGEINNDE